MDYSNDRNATEMVGSTTSGQKNNHNSQHRVSNSSSSSSGVSSTSTAAANDRSLNLRQQSSSNSNNVFSDYNELQPDNQEAKQSPFGSFLNALSRKKPLDCRTDTNLNRCLNLVDLTALGVGSTLGLGLYVLAGQVASNKAGPGVVLSFALAALASAFSALCYAEFAGRVPRAGSAYAYSYITVGEFVAFVIGWNLILEYVIGAASVARGFSGYLCFVFNHLYTVITKTTTTTSALSDQLKNETASAKEPIVVLHGGANHHLYHHQSRLMNGTLLTSTLSSNITTGALSAAHNSDSSSLMENISNYVWEYFDWPSIVIIVVITMFVLFGVKESTNFTMAFTTLNLLVVFIVCFSSLKYLDLKNWRLTKQEVPEGFGEGGFLPYGWSGILAGSATCFFGFIGFDTIASSAEEARNPKRNVPISIILSLFISFLAYMSIAIVQTLLWPYYDQNKVTILPYIFDRLDMPIVYWIVLLGAIAGLASSQLGGMYPLPRILYSMANDKLIYNYLSKVNKKLKLPVRATIVGSMFIALLSCLLDIQDLADMVSIGTLAAYSLVSLSVLILRYEDRSKTIIDDSTILNNHLTLDDIVSTTRSTQIDDFNSTRSNNNSNGNTRTKKNQNQQKSKLSARPSTPIREKGSRPLVAQLSVGFNSWFKKSEDDNNPEQQNQHQNGTTDLIDNNHNKKKTSRQLINLLMCWSSSSKDHNDKNHFSQAKPSAESSKQSKILISILVILSILLDFSFLFMTSQPAWLFKQDSNLDPITVLKATSCFLLVLLFVVMFMLSKLPTGKQNNQTGTGNTTLGVNYNNTNDMFLVPWVPLIPTLSILVNTFLMLNLSYLTWVRFTVWMALGLFIYFTYGIWNSEGYLLYLDR